MAHLGAATAALLLLASTVGGALNSVAGGGSFIVFPALLFAGVSPIPANATTTIALWPGSLASVMAYRRELKGARGEIIPMGLASLAGGLAGSILLLRTSDAAFVRLIPWLLLFASVVFTVGGSAGRLATRRARVSLGFVVVVQFAISVYGGYFGGGIGIMMLATLSLLGMTDIHRMNAMKTLQATLINGIAVTAFIAAQAVDWGPGIVMIVGSTCGGYLGAAVARRLRPAPLRKVVLAVAWSMTAYFFARAYAS